jgi:hypothetical protein
MYLTAAVCCGLSMFLLVQKKRIMTGVILNPNRYNQIT